MSFERAARFRDFGKAWGVQRRVIGALLMREVMTRYGRHNIGFLWLFVEPMMFTVGITALWTISGANHGTSIPIAAFAISGYSSVLLWRNMPSRCIGAVNPNLSLMYHRQVKVLDVFAARIILEALGATMSFIALSIFFAAIGWVKAPEDFSKVLAGWMMLIWFGASLAVFLGALSEISEIVEKLWHPIQYLLFPLSGAAFILDILPKQARDLLIYLPMVNGTELVRDGYFGSAFKAHYDIPYMALCCTVLTIAALAQTRIVARRVIPE
jgi:ABC-type polysaccharide/polyol phosphate export permease